MGLDQWIRVVTYHSDNENNDKFEVKEYTYRKENWLRNWVIENTSLTHESNCEPTFLKKKQIKELYQSINKVLEDHDLAYEELPTSDGFFFGPTEYDDWYFEGLEIVKNNLEEILKNEKVVYIIYDDWW